MMMIDDETINIIVRSGMLAMISGLCLVVRNLYVRFQRMEDRSSRVDSNHAQVQEQLKAMQISQANLQESIDTIMQLLLNNAVRKTTKRTRHDDK